MYHRLTSPAAVVNHACMQRLGAPRVTIDSNSSPSLQKYWWILNLCVPSILFIAARGSSEMQLILLSPECGLWWEVWGQVPWQQCQRDASTSASIATSIDFRHLRALSWWPDSSPVWAARAYAAFLWNTGKWPQAARCGAHRLWAAATSPIVP